MSDTFDSRDSRAVQPIHVNCPFSRSEWEARLREVDRSTTGHLESMGDKLDAILSRLDKINGRVGRTEDRVAHLEMKAEVVSQIVDERTSAIKGAAGAIATLISLVIGLAGFIAQHILSRR